MKKCAIQINIHLDKEEYIHRLKGITPRKYFNQRILDVDGRFARDVEYLFAAQYAVKAKQIMDDANNFIFWQHPGRQNSGQPINAGFLKNTEKLQELVHRDYAFKFMKNVRGSPAYFQRIC